MAEESDGSVSNEEFDTDPNAAKKKKRSILPLIMIALNSVGLAGLLGVLVYTQFLYERPKITESAEREKLEEANEEGANIPEEVSYVEVSSFVATLKPSPKSPESVEALGDQIQGITHKAAIAFFLELNHSGDQLRVSEVIQPFMDRLLTLLGNKSKEKLTTVQGRFILKKQIVEIMNKLAGKPVVTDVHFTELVVQ